MAVNIKGCIKMGKSVGSANINGLMVASMRAVGSIIVLKGMVNIYGQTEEYTKAAG